MSLLKNKKKRIIEKHVRPLGLLYRHGLGAAADMSTKFLDGVVCKLVSSLAFYCTTCHATLFTCSCNQGRIQRKILRKTVLLSKGSSTSFHIYRGSTSDTDIPYCSLFTNPGTYLVNNIHLNSKPHLFPIYFICLYQF